MKTSLEKKREILKAALLGDKETFEKLTKDESTIWFEIKGMYYKNSLENPISKEIYDNEFNSNDTLIEFGENSGEGIESLMKRFGCTNEEISERLRVLEIYPETTANEIIKLKNRLQNEK